MDQKSIKDFLKLDWKKSLIFIILVLLNFIPAKTIFIISSGTFGTYHGFPFIFYASGNGFSKFNYFFLFLDLVIFYLLSCISVFVYGRIRARKK